jgi:hypothetical protein
MGQHRLPAEVRALRNGRATPLQKRVRVVRDVRLENVESEGVTMLMLGERAPELAAPMSPAEARKLAAALVAHADAVERASGSRIILPGG